MKTYRIEYQLGGRSPLYYTRAEAARNYAQALRSAANGGDCQLIKLVDSNGSTWVHDISAHTGKTNWRKLVIV